MPFQKLFEPIRIGRKNIRNRIAMSPMATLHSQGGYVTEQILAWYGARARGGVGLVIVECTFTSKWGADNSYYNNLCLYDTTHMIGLAELAETVHAFGAKIFIQLTPGFGVQGSSRRTGVQPVAPSAIRFESPPEMAPREIGERMTPELAAHMVGEVPREMTIEEIQGAQDDFVRAVGMAGKAGFDGVEIHACHGYLLHDFLSPRFNRRADLYGGSLGNRMRFLIELVRKARAAAGDGMVLGVRASADEHMPGGTTYEDMKVVVQRLEQEGIDYFNMSDGSYEALKYFLPEEDGTMLEEATGFKKLVRFPIITPSIHDPELAERAVSEAMTDIVSLGRQLIADPDWANKVKEGRVADIRKCDRCYRECILRLVEGLGIKCAVNPEAGLERYNPDYTRWAAKRRAIEKRQGKREMAVVR